MTASATNMPEMYGRVYEAIDASVSVLRCLPRSEAVVQNALSHFRTRNQDREALDQLAAMSVQLEALRASTQIWDSSARIAARDALSAVAQRWIERLPIH